ncbi:MAG: 3-deoxy-7-phosphoheptulonate synthase [Planctomycetota bacterium]
MNNEDRRIEKVRPLITPAILAEEWPSRPAVDAVVSKGRQQIEAILDGHDRRLLVVVGPCSIHELASAREYGERLSRFAESVAERLLIVMRVYFEKPRTVVGWKGLINDPDLDDSYQINKGLRLARQLLLELAGLGLPVGTEFLDTTFGQFYADLISWGAIGARTAESQIHRELASGLSMPVGIKNRTDGDVQVAVDAISAAGHRHLFPSLTKQGAPAILQTQGNPHAHLILRGGSKTGPNYSAECIAKACELLRAAMLPEYVVVDCSHGNSQKDPDRQADVLRSVAIQRRAGASTIRGIMIESHLKPGRQDISSSLMYGQSITDACLGFDETTALLNELADRMEP